MKKILFLLLITVTGYGQTLQNPTFGTVKITNSATVTTTPTLTTTEANGLQSKITPANLPVSTATQTALDAKVTANSPITPGTNTKITYDSKGLITSGTGLIASDIPNILESQVTGLVSDLNGKVTGTNATDSYKNIYYMGDSLTDDGTYIYTISSILGNTWYNYNYGRSGETTSQMLARFNTDIINKNNPSHVVILAGTNDVSGLTPAATIEANLQSMYTAAHNAGIKVIAVTITPRTTTGPQLTIQQAVNTWIKTTATNVDYVVDPYVTLADPSNPTVLLPTYTTDGLHMTVSGYTVLGTYIANNATWVAKVNSTNLTLAVKGYGSVNQNLNTDSNPIFNTINGITVGNGSGNVYTNVALGGEALKINTYGKFAIGIGYQALSKSTTGRSVIGIGYQALLNSSTGSGCIAMGNNALKTSINPSNLISIGDFSMLNTTTATNIIALGVSAYQSNTTGSSGTAIGTNSLFSNTTGNGNSGIGPNSLYNQTTGSGNLALGFNSGRYIADGSTALAVANNSLFIGNDTKALASGGTHETAIGVGVVGLGSNSTNIGNPAVTKTAIAGNLMLGSTTDSGEKLQVTGTAKITGVATLSVSPTISSETANTIASFDATKNVKSLSTSTYPSLTELAYVKGLNNPIQPQIDAKAPLSSPVLTGVPTAPTASTGTNTTQLATTAFVTSAINTDVSIQKIVDNSTKTGLIDSGNSYIELLEGTADNRRFEVTTADGTSSAISTLKANNTQAVLLNESSTAAGGLLVAAGVVTISQTNVGSGTTYTGFEPATTNTFINNPANSVSGTYTYQMQPKQYTVAALPTPTGSDSRFAIVTDATAPTYLGALTGGGSVVCPAFWNGSAWVSH